MLQQMTDIILIETEKSFLIFRKLERY